MKTIWIITKRELNSYFDSLIAIIMIVLFLGFSGFFTWISGSDIFLISQATLRPFFGIAYWTLFFFIPALTMRTFAEENRSGTIEMLLTKPVTDRQVILGKYLATIILIAVALALTLPYVITISKIGNLDAGGTVCGYLALIAHKRCLCQHRDIYKQYNHQPDSGFSFSTVHRPFLPYYFSDNSKRDDRISRTDNKLVKHYGTF